MENDQDKVPKEPNAPEMLVDEELEDISGGWVHPPSVRSTNVIKNNNGGKPLPKKNDGRNNGTTGGPGY